MLFNPIFFQLALQVASAFELVEIGPKNGEVAVGGKVTLLCKSDNWFEHCVWKHNGRLCQFEWKRSHGGVRKQSCMGLHSRVHYVGDYNKHECAVEIQDVTAEDSGTWTCNVESYVLGDVSSGYIRKADINLRILPKTTTTASTTSTTTSTFSFTTKEPEVIKTDTTIKDDTFMPFIIDETSEKTTTIFDDTIELTTMMSEVEVNVTEKSLFPESEDLQGQDLEPASNPVAAIVIGSVIGILLVAACAAFFGYRMRQKKKAAIFSNDAEQNAKISMMKLELERFAEQDFNAIH